PALRIPALTFIVVHSGIVHEEYRVIYPAVVLLTVVAGLGLAQLVEWGTEWLAGRGIERRTAAIGCAALLFGYWGALSFAVWTGPGFVQLRDRDHDNLMAVSYAAEIPGLCGIGLYGEH